MSSRFTHAIISRIPNTVQFDGKHPDVDLVKARKEQEELCDVLRVAGVDVIELAPEESASVSSLWVDDLAVIINGTALVTRPKRIGRTAEVAALLQELAWQVYECPAVENGKGVVLEGSDVLYTGKEIFVGIRAKSGTNLEGVMAVAKSFPDFATVPVTIEGTKPLKHYVSLISQDVLSVSSCKEGQNILKRIEREATYRYTTVTLEQEQAVNCMNINGHLIFRSEWDSVNAKLAILQDAIKFYGVTVGELTKMGGQLSQYCLLVRKIKHLKNLW